MLTELNTIYRKIFIATEGNIEKSLSLMLVVESCITQIIVMSECCLFSLKMYATCIYVTNTTLTCSQEVIVIKLPNNSNSISFTDDCLLLSFIVEHQMACLAIDKRIS